MSLKLYIHWEQAGYPEKTSKIQIPKSWLAKSVKEVIGLFAMPYNNVNKDTPIELDNVHLETTEGVKIYSNDVVGDVLEDRFDYHIKLGAHVKADIEKDAVVEENLVRCKNYGCNQFFSEEHNHDEACQHHTGPPIFHDTMKCWSCCRDRKAFDFESFQLITGCAMGRHSTVAQKVAIAASPNAPSESGAPVAAPVQLKSIADFNTKNPDAASAASAAAKIVTAARKSTRSADGCSAKCQRKGCQKDFVVAENSPTACNYHTGNPVFHDAIKLWSCCPDKKCYDFDEFMAVPGCAQGHHDDGVIEL
eukprot:CAMPEP_0184976242 /NCGR_PEP_ID=MMETSP1098-20130426/7246_1 /TAXON_ID=89044 /ORGANISM="Spumella elongata, Strain CCAP 955/1" /LENGTH=305 /DNA_ID=CAMNT_0027499079 /DNA_START=46 /DNA_END=963 /DNA_ORIENTATION=-